MDNVTCKICGKEVAKHRTLHIGNGDRACREHPETQPLADKAHGTIQAQHKAHEERQKQRLNRRQQTWDPRPRCMVCDHVGLRSDEWFTRLLIEHQKYEMTTGKVAFSMDREENEKMKGELKDVACLFPFDLDIIKKQHIQLTRTGWEVAQLLNGTFICADCAMKLNLPNPFPTLTAEQLRNWSIVGQVVKPTIEKIASDELKQ